MHAYPTPSSSSSHHDLAGLVRAVAQGQGDDALGNPLQASQWEALAPYLQPLTLATGHTLFARGAADRTLYIVEHGSVSVHYEDDKKRLRLAIVSAGSVLGELGFFSPQPRRATAQTGAPTKLWALPSLRLTELSNRQPAVALALTHAVGAVLARRLLNRHRRIAAT